MIFYMLSQVMMLYYQLISVKTKFLIVLITMILHYINTIIGKYRAQKLQVLHWFLHLPKAQLKFSQNIM